MAAYVSSARHPRVLEPAPRALDDKDPKVRQWAALSVAKMGDRRGWSQAIAHSKDQISRCGGWRPGR